MFNAIEMIELVIFIVVLLRNVEKLQVLHNQEKLMSHVSIM